MSLFVNHQKNIAPVLLKKTHATENMWPLLKFNKSTTFLRIKETNTSGGEYLASFIICFDILKNEIRSPPRRDLRSDHFIISRLEAGD